MKVHEEMLVGAAELGARRVALELVEEAVDAADRLTAGEDPEALHDLRVAVRRLRSAVRAYREDLRDGVGRKARRTLRDFARASGAARDAEVLEEWLGRLGPELSAESHGGAEWMAGRLAERKAAAYDAVRTEV